MVAVNKQPPLLDSPSLVGRHFLVNEGMTETSSSALQPPPGITKVYKLIEERYAEPANVQLDKDIFISGIRALDDEPCIWCRYPRVAGELLRLLSFPPNDATHWFHARTTASLSSCAACLQSYYEVRPTLEEFGRLYEEDTLVVFWRKVGEFDKQRVGTSLDKFATGELDHRSSSVLFALYELLLYPKHLQDNALHEKFTRVLKALVEARKMIKVTRVLPGLFMCLFDEDEIVWRWANSVLTKNDGSLGQVDDFIKGSFDPIAISHTALRTEGGRQRLELLIRWLPVKACCDHFAPLMLTLLNALRGDSFVYKSLDALVGKAPMRALSEELWRSFFASVLQAVPLAILESEHRWIHAFERWCDGLKTHSNALQDLAEAFEHRFRTISSIPEYSALIALFTDLVSLKRITLLMASCPRALQLLSEALGRCAGSPTLLDPALRIVKVIFLIDIATLGTHQGEMAGEMMKKVLALPSHFQTRPQAQLVALLMDQPKKFWVEYGKARPGIAGAICVHLQSLDHPEPRALELLLVLSATASYSLDVVKLDMIFKSHPVQFINCFSAAVGDIFATDAHRLLPLIYLNRDVIQKSLFAERKSLLDMFPEKHLMLQKLLDAVVLLCMACLGGGRKGGMGITILDSLTLFLGRLLSVDPSLGLDELKKDHLLRIIEELVGHYCTEGKSDRLAEKIGNLLGLATERRLKFSLGIQRSLDVLFLSLRDIPDLARDRLDRAINDYERQVGMPLPRLPLPISAVSPSSTSTVKRSKAGVDEDLGEKILLGMQTASERRKERALPISLRSSLIPLAAPRTGSKLEQLKAEAARDAIPAVSSAPRKRFAPHPSLSSAVKLERLDHRISSASESDIEDDFMALRNKFDGAAPGKTLSGVPRLAEASAPSRSVKLIDVTDAGASSKGNTRSAKEDKLLGEAPDELTLIRRFHQKILNFNLQQNIEATTADEPLLTVPSNFASASEYVSVFEPLLFVECRAQLVASAEDAVNDEIQRLRIAAVAHVDNYHEIQLQGGLESSSNGDDRGSSRLGDQDYLLVYFENTFNEGPTNDRPAIRLPAVVVQTTFKAGIFESTARLIIPPDQPALQLELREGGHLRFLRIGNVITNFREYIALHSIHTIQLAPIILNPSLPPLTDADSASLENLGKLAGKLHLNKSQARAIQTVLEHHSPMTLVQGPPGTGKTRTIEGLLGMLVGRSTRERKILICAPSNAAIDEIVRRVRHGLYDALGQHFLVRIIRIGAIDMISEDVKDLTVEGLVDQQLRRSTEASTDLLNEQRKKCEELRQSLDSAEQARHDEARLRTLRTALWEAKESMRKNVKFIEDTRSALRQKILKEAQIVCCTLSSSGHDMLSRLNFDTVIIDEACQAVELSCLIPLQRNVRRCVLVGDPNQLPPTVISQMAGVYSYEQSLFVRLQRSCPRSVLLLDTQYRMHPEISRFPNQYFYEGRIVDGPGMATANARDWHAHPLLGPFRFFDVHGGREESRARRSGLESRSKLNELEARVAANLVALICQQTQQPMAGKIGLVTPYKDQRRALRRELISRFGPSILANVEISTVDGFQGQEKEVIIFSCVRTSEPGTGRGLGFLNDTRRLNVALTRAKCSLLVLGRAASLMRNPIWEALIEDARSRGCLVKEEPAMWESVQRIRVLPSLLRTSSQDSNGEGARLSRLKTPSTIKTPAQRRLEAQKEALPSPAPSSSVPQTSPFIKKMLDHTRRRQQ